MKKDQASEKTVHAVVEMLRIARNYNQELSDLRRRLRDVENGIRLTEQGLPQPESTQSWRFGQRMTAPSPSRECMTQMYADQRDQIDKRLRWIGERRAQLDRLLASLDETELRVINLRWIDGKSWRAVSLRIYMCERNGQRIQKRAIERMARLLEEEWRQVDQERTSSSSTSNWTSAAQNLARKS